MRIPTSESDSMDYARFTFDQWRGLDQKYSFYVEKWRRTLNFLRDAHWKALDEFDRDVLPSWKRFPLQNYTLAFYNDYLTDYLKSEVRFSAVPASPDPHDIDAAELSEQLLKYLWGKLGLDRKRIDLAAWLVATGVAMVRVYWDTNTGQHVPIGIPTPDGGIIPVDPDTMQPRVGEPDIVDRGEIDIEVISPQYVRWADSPAHGVMVALLMTYEEVKTFYGEDVAERLQYSEEHAGLSADLSHIERPGTSGQYASKRTLLIEHYLPRSFTHPMGLWWTCAQDGNMMIHEPWPLPAGKIPIVNFRWIPVPGEPQMGLSPLYGLTFQNKIYEEVTARILEWYQRAKPKRLLKSGGGVAPGDITDEPYQELMVNQGGEPTSLEVQDAPAGLFRILNQTQADMSFTSGKALEDPDQTNDGSATIRFRTPPELKSGRAITTAHLSSKASWKELGEIVLHYVGEFYTEGRVVALQGPDRGFLWREFSGDDLLSTDNLAATVSVDEIPLFPENRQNLRDTVIALLQTQAGQIIFSDESGQIDMDRVNAALKATGLDTNLDVVDPDVLEARNEQVEFQNLNQGMEPPPVESWQNHAAHYDEHTKILKSIRFRAWSDESKQAFLQHVGQTEEILNQQAQEEAQAMVDQERQLRQVREQEELKADVMREWAKSLIALVAETTGLEIHDIMGLLERPEAKDKSNPSEEGESE